MESTHPPLIRTRLSVLMFLQFFVWGSWLVEITGYAEHLEFSGSQIGWLGSVAAVGAIISPLFVGLIADRFFSAQRVLCVLHLLSAACVIAAGFVGTFMALMILMLLTGLTFMPTIALANSVAFRHIPDPDRFPRIAVLGTIGWIVAVLVASVFLGGTKEPNFLFQAGVGGVVLALYALTLPDTPPKGAEAGGDVFGLSALKLLKDPVFLVFVSTVFLFSIPACGYFFALMMPMLQQRGYPAPLALTSLNQFAEIVFMFSMPWFVAKLGLKRVLLLGMASWAVRYLCFASPEFWLALLGLVLHGMCYSFFYVGAYMWIDRRAPAELKSSAQSLVAFLLLGVGYFAGAKGAGFMMERYPAEIPHMPAHTVVEVAEAGEAAEGLPHRIRIERTREEAPDETLLSLDNGSVEVTETKKRLPSWEDPQTEKSAWRYLDLSSTVKELLKSEEEKAKEKKENQAALVEQLDADGDETISPAEVDDVGESGVSVDGLVYTKKEIAGQFESVQEGFGMDEDEGVTRSQWLDVVSKPDLLAQLDADEDGNITLEEVEAAESDEIYVDGKLYPKDDLRVIFRRVHKELGLEGNVVLNREQWLAVQANNWQPIWLWPSVFCFVLLGLFALGFRDKPVVEEPAPDTGEVGEDHAAASGTAPPEDQPPGE